MKTAHRLARPVLLIALMLAAGCASTAGAPAAPRIGVQLWSVKDEIKHDFEGTLAKLAALGFQGVEFAGEFGRFRHDPAGLRAFLDKYKLACAGAHVPFEQFAPAKFDATTSFYITAGCTDLIVPADSRAGSTDGSAELARDLSALSARLAPLGMRTGYHNHAQEMTGPDGQSAWDVLARGTPGTFILQQDVGWTHAAGNNPVAFIERYPGRSVSLHIKAKLAKGASGIPIIGQDDADWVATTRAAHGAGGTRWLIVEQEEYPNGMGQLEAVAASMRGLQAVLVGLRLPERESGN